MALQATATIAPDTVGDVAVGVALSLFLLGCALFVAAVAVGALRAGRGEPVDILGLFLLQGSAPRPVTRFFGLCTAAVTVVALATAFRAPFGLLVPVLPIGAAGLWAARHGHFAER